MILPTFLEASARLSVNINGFFFPYRESIKTLQAYCKPLTFLNDDVVYELSFSGTCFWFKCKNRFFSISTLHQVTNQNRDPKNIAIITNNFENTKAIGVSELSKLKPRVFADENLKDILLAEFNAPENVKNFSCDFFEFNPDKMADLNTVTNRQIQAIFTIGYPSDLIEYQPLYDDVSGLPISIEVKTKFIEVLLELDDDDSFHEENRIPFKLSKYNKIEKLPCDGMSGAPVFFIYSDTIGNSQLGLAGIITHGNEKGRFSVYDAALIKAVIVQSVLS